MKKINRNYWSTLFSVLVLWIANAALLTQSVQFNNGHFCYPLDDVFIHMAMAKNFVLNGVWGVDSHSFQSATSSPLWTLLLSGVYFVFGVNTYTPLIMNIVFGTILIILVDYIMQRYSVSTIIKIPFILAIIFFTPLLPVIFGGMEHILQILLVILFVFISLELLTDNISKTKTNLLLFLSPFVATIRYESLFLIFVICCLFFLKRKYLISITLGLTSIFPLVVYGLVSHFKGWYFLPNSILLKGKMPFINNNYLLSFIHNGYNTLISNLHLSILVILALIFAICYFKKNEGFWSRIFLMLIIFISMSLFHVFFAGMGWVYRYEAYLMVLGFLVISITLSTILNIKSSTMIFKKKFIPMYFLIILLISILIFPYYERGKSSLNITKHAIKNIYEQQYQMGLFIKTYYNKKAVALNDIGAVNFLADIKCLDLWGLSSIEVAKAKRNYIYNTDFINKLANKHDIEIAIIYDHWYDYYGGVPSTWIKVGEWTIPDNFICGGETVSFYTVHKTVKDDLIFNLKNFSSRLPKGVKQYIYTSDGNRKIISNKF